MQDYHHLPPFKTLGTRLKYLRENSRESIAEAAGAVEIDADALERIEEGLELPSEEILMLLMSHFNMQDSEAVQVWELAGYDRKNGPDVVTAEDLMAGGKPVVMLLAIDVRTQYTDGVDIFADAAGVTMNFTQHSNQAGQNGTSPVARVGMSIEQAEAVSRALQLALLKVRYGNNRSLPAPRVQHPSSPSDAHSPKHGHKPGNPGKSDDPSDASKS